jgi:hypothetical protein
LAKLRSMTPLRSELWLACLVKEPGLLRSVWFVTEAFSKYGSASVNSALEKVLDGSEVGWCMLKSPTTSDGRFDEVKIVEGGTERWYRFVCRL